MENKKEGLRHGVDATPTLFINGRRYAGRLRIGEVVDVLLEEWDREAGHQYATPPSPEAQSSQ